MRKDLGHGEIWRSQHRSRGEGSGTPKVEIVDGKRSKTQLRTFQKTLKLKKDLGHGEIWRSQHRSRGEGSGTPQIEIIDGKRSKQVAKTKNKLKLKKDPGHGEIRRSQRRLRSEGTGTPKIACNFENRGEYLYRPLLFWDQKIRQ